MYPMSLNPSRHLSRGGQRTVRAILVALALLALVYALAFSLATPSGAHSATRLADGPTPSAPCPANLFSC